MRHLVYQKRPDPVLPGNTPEGQGYILNQSDGEKCIDMEKVPKDGVMRITAGKRELTRQVDVSRLRRKFEMLWLRFQEMV